MGRGPGRWVGALLVVGACLGAVLLAHAEDQPSWLESLGVENGVERQVAIEALAANRADLSDDLIAALDDELPPRTIGAMADVLATMALTPLEVETVEGLLASVDPVVRFAAVRVLRGHPTAAVGPLARLAADADEPAALRAAAAAALAPGGAEATGALASLAGSEAVPSSVRHAALRAWASNASSGMEGAAKVAADLQAPWPDREAAIDALGRSGLSLPAAALALLQNKDARTRARMVRALIDRADPMLLSAIAVRLGDTDAMTRWVALEGVASYQGLLTHRAALLLRLSDPDPRVQALAARHVGTTCADVKTTVVPALRGLLASANFRVRHAAALALLRLQDKSGQATMKTDAASPNPSQAVQAQAAYDAIRLANW